MIRGIFIKPLKVFSDERGKVMHMLRSDDPLFKQFGEVYFSVVNPGIVKGWKKHLRMTQHFAVPVGKIQLVLYDERKNSPTIGKVDTIEIGEENYALVRIPPLVWYGFKGISLIPTLITNCTDLPYDPKETENVNIGDSRIPYVWNK